MPRKQGVVNRDVNATQRAVKAVALRAQRLTYQEIANAVGYGSPSACRDAIMRELDRCVVKEVAALRAQELDMLDRLHAAVWLDAFPPEEEEEEDEGDSRPKKRRKQKRGVNLFAIDRLLTISERRSKLLGLDITPKEQLTNQNYTKRVVLTHTEEVYGATGH